MIPARDRLARVPTEPSQAADARALSAAIQRDTSLLAPRYLTTTNGRGAFRSRAGLTREALIPVLAGGEKAAGNRRDIPSRIRTERDAGVVSGVSGAACLLGERGCASGRAVERVK